MDKWLDAGLGCCVLKNPDVRKVVNDTFYFFNEERYILHSFVIMPNHVHVLVELLGENTINNVLHSWKRHSANTINRMLGKKDQFWEHESYDRIIRDKTHYKMVMKYIIDNPKSLDPDSYTLMITKNNKEK
ncbi:MAG: transposase [Paludibacteraceae bacterium]|nr:transposase [Paludibacteraceae bacterium]